MMAFDKKTWANNQGGGTPLDASGLNDLESRIADSIDELDVDLASHKADKVTELVSIEEPYNQSNTTTIDLGYKPDFVEIQAVIRQSPYFSNGFITSEDGTDAGVMFNISSGTAFNMDSQIGTRSIHFYSNSTNYIAGRGYLTENGFQIVWTVEGNLDLGSATRRLHAVVHRHGKE